MSLSWRTSALILAFVSLRAVGLRPSSRSSRLRSRWVETLVRAGSSRAVRPDPDDRRRYSAPIGALNATLDRTFFALSDPTRRGILERLGRGPATIGELAEPFGLTLNGVKKHVGILEEVDLVVTAKVGRARECQLGPAQLVDATKWISNYRRTWQRRLDRFGAHVEGTGAG
jgi:DNA-binding transcriptional ArsR family regulator